ncbi:MAG: hypothetical protein IKU10_06530 [Clostridia bacterium]|nr:hypothetical protein [Clostridia bacterium]
MTRKAKKTRDFVRLSSLFCWSYIDTLVSGSPIVQNGKLVGAITHVFLNQPEKGYGIFAENMLETAQSVADQQKLNEAS